MSGGVGSVLEQRSHEVASLLDVLSGSAGASGDEPSRLGPLLRESDDGAVLELVERLGGLLHAVDSLLSVAAGEVQRRSRRELEEPLAKRMGERSAAALLAVLTGVSAARASEWTRVGGAVASTVSLSGEMLPPRLPALAAAVEQATISCEAASLVAATIGQVERLTSEQQRSKIEQALVTHAAQLTLHDLAKVCRAVRDHVDVDGIEPREDELRAAVAFKISRRPDGMTRWIVDADPESAGFLTAALDAATHPRRGPRFVDSEASGGTDTDDRTPDQVRLDALVTIAKQSLKTDPGDMSGTAVTMLVTVPLDALQTGVGVAEISGVTEPVSARTARRLACEAEIIPIVLNGNSKPIDYGAARRLFSSVQRQAMAVRDGGCCWPGCDAPPSRCDAAHVTPWALEPNTDLDNGVLLCRFHHRRFDNDGWGFRITEGVPYLVPPPWVDPQQRPRRAGRPPRAA